MLNHSVHNFVLSVQNFQSMCAMLTTVFFIAVVVTVSLPITYIAPEDTLACVALELVASAVACYWVS